MTTVEYSAAISRRWQQLVWLIVPILFIIAVFMHKTTNQAAAKISKVNKEKQEIKQASSDSSEGQSKPYKIREGSKFVDEKGFFRLSGDRATFQPQKGKSINSLENLNLERVVLRIEASGKIGTDNPQRLQWKVSGTITEYRGGNYLLISRAILINKGALIETNSAR